MLWEALEHQLALAMLDSLPTDDPSSSFQRCRILTMAGDHLAAAASANEFLARWPQSGLALDVRWMLGYNIEKLGYYRDAGERFRSLADEDTLLSEIALLHRASCHRASGRADLAQALLDSLRRRPPSFEDDIDLLPPAMAWTMNGSEGPPVNGAAPRLSRSLRKVNRAINQAKHQYALSLLARFLRNNPRSSETGLAHYLIGKSYEKMGRLDKASQSYRLAGARQPSSPYADDGLFRAGWCLYKNNDIAGCLTAWDSLKLRHPQSSLLPAADYWRYRLAVETGDTVERERLKEKILSEYHFSYYWWRLRQTLVASDSEAVADTAASGNISGFCDFTWWLAGRRQYRQVFRLLDLGLLEDARQLADRLREASGNDVLALYHLSLIYHRLGQDPLAIHLAKKAQSMWLGTRPRELYQVLYPRRYLHSIRKEAGLHGLDPALVLAVMRQESRFVAKARSRAGARGLMQIMPKTGRRLMGSRKFRADTLYHPNTSIHYGTKFLARLVDQFDGSLVRALGAYNAGPQRMNGWLKSPRSRRDDDFLVEDINIAETRDYIKKVLEGYYIYSWLLGAAP
jgi:soluble lytic murein transglycosylase